MATPQECFVLKVVCFECVLNEFLSSVRLSGFDMANICWMMLFVIGCGRAVSKNVPVSKDW